MITFLIACLFGLQGIAMFVDEFYFHHKRGLPKWERIGHPMDTITVTISFAYLLLHEFTPENFTTYLSLFLFSCFFVTKDEFVHSQYCDPKENWLHAILFILHPLIFLGAAYAWLLKDSFLLQLVRGQALLTVLFLIYQLIYWNTSLFRKGTSHHVTPKS